jgi:hypothetical protein
MNTDYQDIKSYENLCPNLILNEDNDQGCISEG